MPLRLYKLHPVYKRIYRAGFIGQEIVSVLNFLERARVFSGQEIALLREQNVRVREKLSLAAQRNQSLINEIAVIEKSLTPEQKKQILGAGFKTVSEITGIPVKYLREVHSDIRWEHKAVQELQMGEAELRRRKTIEDVPKGERKKLLELVSKRLSHNLLIQGSALRVFYQAIPLMQETLDMVRPGLAEKYIGFSATLQLQNLLYEGEFSGTAAGMVRARISPGRRFRIFSSGINFPSLFHEMVKGTFEALLHHGMPTKQQVGEHEQVFHDMTSGGVLEFEEHKISPQASLRMHRLLAEIAKKNYSSIQKKLERTGYQNISLTFAVSMLYKAFSQLSPTKTSYFFARAVQEGITEKIKKRLYNELLQNMG